MQARHAKPEFSSSPHYDLAKLSAHQGYAPHRSINDALSLCDGYEPAMIYMHKLMETAKAAGLGYNQLGEHFSTAMFRADFTLWLYNISEDRRATDMEVRLGRRRQGKGKMQWLVPVFTCV